MTYPVHWWHCSKILRREALAYPCEQKAAVFYIRPDGVKEGYCLQHKDEAKRPGLIEVAA